MIVITAVYKRGFFGVSKKESLFVFIQIDYSVRVVLDASVFAFIT